MADKTQPALAAKDAASHIATALGYLDSVERAINNATATLNAADENDELGEASGALENADQHLDELRDALQQAISSTADVEDK
jgi:hypothetical protein